MHTNIEIIRKYRKLLRKKKRLNSLLFSYLHCDSKLVELYKNAYITTYSNIKIKQKLVIKFMLIVLLIEKKVLYCLGLIEE